MSANRFDFIEFKIEIDNEKKSDIERIESEIERKKWELNTLERQRSIAESKEEKEDVQRYSKEIEVCAKELESLKKSFEPFEYFEKHFEPIKLPEHPKKSGDEKAQLPYSENLQPYTENYEKIEDTLLLARGDTRPIEKINEIGGFHPQATAENSKPKEQEHIFNPSSHSLTAQGSALVSFTDHMRSAKTFSRYSVTSEQSTVYFAKVRGALHDRHSDYEGEYTVAGGVEKDDIVAYRKVSPAFNFEGSIYIRKDFIQEYPELVGRVIKQFLEPGDKPLPSPHSKGYQGTMFHSKDKTSEEPQSGPEVSSALSRKTGSAR